MNVDKIIESLRRTKEDKNSIKDWIYSVTGIKVENTDVMEKTLDIKCYYWYYDITDSKEYKNEKLYEFRTLNDIFLIYAEEITTFPFEDCKCFEDTDTFLATGITLSVPTVSVTLPLI